VNDSGVRKKKEERNERNSRKFKKRPDNVGIAVSGHRCLSRLMLLNEHRLAEYFPKSGDLEVRWDKGTRS
jgi:hypothetical protein